MDNKFQKICPNVWGMMFGKPAKQGVKTMIIDDFIEGLKRIDNVIKKAGGETVVYRFQEKTYLGIMHRGTWITSTEALPLDAIGNIHDFAYALETMLCAVRSIDALKLNK